MERKSDEDDEAPEDLTVAKLAKSPDKVSFRAAKLISFLKFYYSQMHVIFWIKFCTEQFDLRVSRQTCLKQENQNIESNSFFLCVSLGPWQA